MTLPQPDLQDLFTNIQAVFFDLDGTLVDTEPVAAQALVFFLQDRNLDPYVLSADDFVGLAWTEVLLLIRRTYNLSESTEEIYTGINQHYRSLLDKNLPILPGAVEAVYHLADNFRLGLVSGSDCVQIEYILGRLDIRHHFEKVYGIEVYIRGKPDPAGYLMAAQDLMVAPRHCLVIEDSKVGIESANSAGMRSLAVTVANHTNQDLSAANGMIETLEQLQSIKVTT